MTVLLTLTTAGSDTGPFDLYSDVDNFTVPFETNVNKGALQSGYLTFVPDAATIVRAQSVGNCDTYTDIPLVPIPPIACGSTAVSGGAGIAERTIDLSPLGGIVIVGLNGQGVPDKFEIIHNGIKKATSGMISANAGPFDDVYGTPPTNVVPTEAQTGPINQFIGSNKGTVPNRNAAFATENPTLAYIVAAPQQQLMWWNYTIADYSLSNKVTIRVTGPQGTAWDFARKCETTSTTSSTTAGPTTTTTSTTSVPMATFHLSTAFADGASACPVISSFPINVNSSCLLLGVGCTLYNIFSGVPYSGGGNWYKEQLSGIVFQLNGAGIITAIFSC